MKLTNYTDEQSILLQLKEGSQLAFENLYHRYSKRLYWKLQKLVHDEDQADEILQDLFLKVWERRDQINIEQPFEAYLHRIAQRMAVDYFRKLERQSKLYESYRTVTTELTENVEELFAAKETQNLLNDAISQLPEQRRRAFKLCKIEGKSHQEAAEIMNISPNTVHNHLVKSVSFLKERLANSGKELTPFAIILLIEFL
ncbi:RNA polymerase sigma factor [Pedobacter xixiisoli]|uniref:RNA polymerase sigma-70 factor, ECF subfamily n=1 Tax=Pedobacter xixiisoli TaxID=1476464 RepID=A0A286A744_9SPHI|nr:RNA polymerase sigma-70 factor [Pedobacter xixiisoli]SOD17705.1 RNA polymerase sigma-70 factor, ECF subfamily [Pedobacter xixiisoli]